jgi:membrane dipeptidase
MILAAGIAAAPHFASGAASDPLDDLIVVNALGGLDDPNVPADASNPLFSDRVLREGRASGLTAVNFTIVAPGEPFEGAVKAVGRFDAAIRRHPRDLVKILSVADIRRAKANGQIGIIYGFQNAALLDNDAGRVDIFADLGVRVIQLTYNPATVVRFPIGRATRPTRNCAWWRNAADSSVSTPCHSWLGPGMPAPRMSLRISITP